METPIPATLLELCDRFPSEEACWEYLRSVRWPRGYRCPRCQAKDASGAPNKTMLAVVAERREHSAGAAHFALVPNGAFESLAPAIRGAIEGADTTFVTDGHYGYRRLSRHGVKHEAHIVNTPERADEILPWVHVVISNLKVWLLGTFRGVSPKHLPRYLLEFTYRFNRRGIGKSLFFYLIRRAMQAIPLPYARLTAERVG